MATKIYKISVLSFLFFFMFSYNQAASHHHHRRRHHHHRRVVNDTIIRWCATTPNPNPCNHFMQKFHPKSHTEFLTMTVLAAAEMAAEAKTVAGDLTLVANTTRQKMALRDCQDLIGSTILQLNTTLKSIVPKATSDVQTWLSAALTNIETCRSELRLAGFSSPVLTGNVSEMIRNSLAVNAALSWNSTAAKTGGRGVPRWLADGDRELLQDYVWAKKATVVVSKDGSGQFSSIQEAINYACSSRVGEERVIVYVKKGVYEENVLISRTMTKVMLVGDGVKNTIITGNRSVAAGYTTYSSATFGVDGNGFIARGISFRNTAGPEGGQAVALRSGSDLSVFYGCSIEGYQDTLFAQSQRQLYKSCYIYGTVDFIFGNAAVVLQNCVIYARKPLEGQANMITAQGRGDPYQNTGISIHNCRIMAAPDLKPVQDSVKTFLGRPWQEFSRTVVIKSYLDDLVDPAGWSKWGDSDFALTSLYYGEYQNFGPGSSTENRVDWAGFHNMTSLEEVAEFTVANLLSGRQWLPATGVPFTAGL